MSETVPFEKPGPVEADLRDAIAPTEEIIAEARKGRMFILVDHEDRENEGDLVIAAEFATPEAVNFMALHGRGLICLPMTAERIDRLGLPMMAVNNSSRHETAFTVSIEAREGVTTGISAADRALTIATAINEQNTRPRYRHARPCLSACARGAAACWCGRAIPRRRSISRGWRG